MKTQTAWFAAVLVLSGCGGGATDTLPAATPPPASAEATASAAPAASASAEASAAPSAAPTAAPAAAPPPGPGPALTVVAMKLAVPKLGGTIDIKADGSVKAGGKTGSKFKDNELLSEKGTAIASVASDGSVKVSFDDEPHKFNEKDELVDAKGYRLAVDDDGTVKLFDESGAPVKLPGGPLKFTGFKPSARRAAVLVAYQAAAVLAMKEALEQVKGNLKKVDTKKK
jgi:hypothetical protein